MDTSPVRILLGVAAQARAERNGDELAGTIVLDQSEPLFDALQNDLLDNEIDVEEAVLDFFADDDVKHYAKLYCDLLEYIILVNWEHREGIEDPVSEHEKMMAIVKSVEAIFTRGDKVGWFVPVLRKVSTLASRTAIRADRSDLEREGSEHVHELARKLLSLARYAAGDPDPKMNDRGRAACFLANVTLRMYFEVNAISLGNTAMVGLGPLGKRIHLTGKADRIMFFFWRGRLLLSQHEIREASDNFWRAFSLCTNRNLRTKRILLTYASATSLPLGIFPLPSLLTYFSLSHLFGPLIHAIKTGNMWMFREALRERRHLLRRRGLWVMMREKGEVLVWRVLFQRTWLYQNALAPQKQPNIKLSVLLSALQLSSRDTSYTLHDAESIVCSLIDQGYAKGYWHQSLSALVFKRGSEVHTQSAFPYPAEVGMQEVIEAPGPVVEEPMGPIPV